MSFSVSDGLGDFEYSSASANGLFANRGHLLAPGFHRMIADLARFNRAARGLLADGAESVSAEYPLRFSVGVEQQRFFNFAGRDQSQLRPVVRLTLF